MSSLKILFLGVVATAAFGILIYGLNLGGSKTPEAGREGPRPAPGASPAPNAGRAESDTVALAGYVRDEVTGKPLEGVELSLPDSDDVHGKTPTCRTDGVGRFRFRDLPVSPQTLQRVRLVARREGYEQSDTYTSLGTTTLPVTLKPTTTPEPDR